MNEIKKGIIIVTYDGRKASQHPDLQSELEACYSHLNKLQQEVINIWAFSVYDDISREIMYEHVYQYCRFFRKDIDFIVGINNPFYLDGSDNDDDEIPNLSEFGIEVIEATHEVWNDDAYLINKYS